MIPATKIHSQRAHILIVVFFIMLLVSEPVLKLYHYNYNPEFRVKAVLKLTFLAIIFFSGSIFKIKREIIASITALTLCFIIGQIALDSSISIFGDDFCLEFLKGDIYIFVKYIYIIFFVAGYVKIQNNTSLTIKLIDLFIGFMIVNTFFVFVGLFTEFDFFKSYPFSSRFGYQGLLELAGESIHLYSIAIVLVYYRFIKNKQKWVLLVVFISGGILLGKKAIFLFLFLLLLVHLIYFKKKFLLYVIVVISLLVVAFKDFFINLLIKWFPFWEPIYRENGLVTLIFSKRDVLLENSIDFISANWSLLNYLFGGVDFFNVRSEFGFFDLFLTFGLVGLVVFVWFIFKFFLIGQSRLIIVLLFLVILNEAVSGGLLINVFPMFIFYLAVRYFKDKHITEYK